MMVIMTGMFCDSNANSPNLSFLLRCRSRSSDSKQNKKTSRQKWRVTERVCGSPPGRMDRPFLPQILVGLLHNQVMTCTLSDWCCYSLSDRPSTPWSIGACSGQPPCMFLLHTFVRCLRESRERQSGRAEVVLFRISLREAAGVWCSSIFTHCCCCCCYLLVGFRC